MGLAFGNLMGAVSSLQAGFGKPQSLKSFIQAMDSMGVQVNSRFEVTFSGIPQSTFFISNITTPSLKQNVTQLYFDGKVVEIPQNYEFDHDFNVTVINDASGVIYSAMTNFLLQDSGSALTNSGYTMVVKAIGDDNFKGSTITLNGVRIKTCSGLQFNHTGGDVQTFDIGCSAIDFNVTPGAMGAVGAAVGAIGKLVS